MIIPNMDEMFGTLRQFAKDATYFAAKCKKPDRDDVILQARLIGTGFAIIGFVGFFVRLLTLPLTKFLVS